MSISITKIPIDVIEKTFQDHNLAIGPKIGDKSENHTKRYLCQKIIKMCDQKYTAQYVHSSSRSS